jgi:hypothetical protein
MLLVLFDKSLIFWLSQTLTSLSLQYVIMVEIRYEDEGLL